MGIIDVTTPSGDVWTVRVLPNRPASPDRSDAARAADVAGAGAPPLDFLIGILYLLYSVVSWIRDRLLPSVDSSPVRWRVEATNRSTSTKWGWLVSKRRAATELIEALEGGHSPETILLEKDKRPSLIRDDQSRP